MSKLETVTIEILTESPGLTREEIAEIVAEKTGKPISVNSLKLGKLGLQGLVKEVPTKREVTVEKVVPTYYPV